METFIHNPTRVEALQVVKPWIRLQQVLPYSRQVKTGSGSLAYLILQRPGQVDTLRAYPGEWLVFHPDGVVEVLTDEEFKRQYTTPELWGPTLEEMEEEEADAAGD